MLLDTEYHEPHLLDIQHPHGLLDGSVPGARFTHGAANAEENILENLKKLDKVEHRKFFGDLTLVKGRGLGHSRIAFSHSGPGSPS